MLLGRAFSRVGGDICLPTLRFGLDMIGVHFLGYDCRSYHQQKFLKVVNQFLQLYSGRKVVELEMLFCIGREFSSEFDQVMHSISKLGVERLRLHFDCGIVNPSSTINPDPNRYFNFSLELLSQASSLKFLCLTACVVQPSVGVRLNSLKTLILMGAPLYKGQLEGILSSCLNLNQLIIQSCKLPYKLCISGTVTFVGFTNCCGLEEIDLRATDLHTLDYSFDERVRFYFSSVPVLKHVKICLTGEAAMAYIFGEFARDLPDQVKSLTVTTYYNQVTHFPTETQVFRNLRKLVLLVVDTDYIDIFKVSPVLDACPLLQYLDLVRRHSYNGKAIGSHHTRPPLSPTYHTELKDVRFGGFRGKGEEIDLAIYILKSAKLLDQMFLTQYLISPCVDIYYGYDIWKKREGQRIAIEQQRQAQAISSNAVVIIK
ncbi:hypothetical protein HAX54_033546 [Datura stramonium]|uniref:At1g61320/AtMIF1 LRR domain-containing protein n=1 Tax=Datura stramonium TaxID=4076 RepID=A0ABS8SDD3_DATST|nr:hypothetical protein [Datura stramonium]